MESFIYMRKQSIPPPLCDEIIALFENTDGKYVGSTLGGVKKEVKDTLDFIIPKNNDTWKNIETFLYRELHKNIKRYIRDLNILYENETNFNILKGVVFQTNSFMVQKYERGKGKYIYHNDGNVEFDNKRYRVITFLWYLNTVEEGGQTEFWADIKIKPETGKLILFPAHWTFPHRGIVPLSDDKYIITGWLYVTHNV